MHLDAWGADDALITVIALHGAGGHGRLMAPFCRTVVHHGHRAIAPDLPLFGLTDIAHRAAVRYADWVELVVDLVAQEAPRGPVVLFGASIGGGLAYDAAAVAAHRGPRVAGVIATALLDPGQRDVRVAASRNRALAATVSLARRLPARLLEVSVPMALTSRLFRMSDTPGLARACARDAQGGGTRAPLAFLLDWLATPPAVEPERFDVGPVLLVHPAQDRWTPAPLSLRFAQRIGAPRRPCCSRVLATSLSSSRGWTSSGPPSGSSWHRRDDPEPRQR